MAININPDNVEPTITRIQMFVEDGEWEDAKDYCDTALDYFPTDGRIFLMQLLAENKVHTISELEEKHISFAESKTYQKVKRFADKKTVDELESADKNIKQYLKDKAELERKEKIYNAALKEKKRGIYQDAISKFFSIAGYKDSDALREECTQKVKEKHEKEVQRKKEEAERLEREKKAEEERREKERIEREKREEEKRKDKELHAKYLEDIPDAEDKEEIERQLEEYRSKSYVSEEDKKKKELLEKESLLYMTVPSFEIYKKMIVSDEARDAEQKKLYDECITTINDKLEQKDTDLDYLINSLPDEYEQKKELKEKQESLKESLEQEKKKNKRKKTIKIAIFTIVAIALAGIIYVATRPTLKDTELLYNGPKTIGTIVDSSSDFSVVETYSDDSKKTEDVIDGLGLKDSDDNYISQYVFKPGKNVFKVKYGDKVYTYAYDCPLMSDGAFIESGENIYESVKETMSSDFSDFSEVGPFEDYGYDFDVDSYSCRLAFYMPNDDDEGMTEKSVDEKPGTAVLTVKFKEGQYKDKEIKNILLPDGEIDNNVKNLLLSFLEGMMLDEYSSFENEDVSDIYMLAKSEKPTNDKKKHIKNYECTALVNNYGVMSISINLDTENTQNSYIECSYTDSERGDTTEYDWVEDLLDEKEAEEEEEEEDDEDYDDDDDYSSRSNYSSGSGGKDYSEGSEWEDYDSDSDGKINDDEFHDAVDDYMTEHGY